MAVRQAKHPDPAASRSRAGRLKPVVPRWLRFSTAAGLLLVGGAGGGYLLYLQRHEEQLSEYRLRQLGRSADNVAAALEGLEGYFKNALVWSAPAGAEGSETAVLAELDQLAAEEKLELAHRLVEGWYHNLLLIETAPGAPIVLAESEDPESCPNGEPPGESRPPGWGLDAEIDGGQMMLRTEAGWSRGRAVLWLITTWRRVEREMGPVLRTVLKHAGADEILGHWRTGWLRAEADLAAHLQPLLPAEDFDAVVLARASGEVLVSVGRQSLRLESLPPAERPVQVKRDGASGAGAADGTPPAEGPRWQGSRTVAYQRSIAGESYDIFVQPVRLPATVRWVGQSPTAFVGCHQDQELLLRSGSPGTGVREDPAAEQFWLIAGMRRSSELGREVRSMTTRIVLGAVALVLLALSALPYLKIRFIGVREALRKQDVLLEAVTVVIASAVMTVAVCELLVLQSLAARQAARLEQLAQAIETAFVIEVDRLSGQLTELSDRRARSQHGPQQAAQVEPAMRQSRASERVRGLLTGRWVNLLRQPDLRLAYPFLEMAYWMEPAGPPERRGRQLEKWSVQEDATPLINVAGRPYFHRVAAGQLLPPEPARSTGGASGPAVEASPCAAEGRFLEVVRSATTGREFVVLSQQTRPCYEEPAVVAAAFASLLSIVDPVLPLGYGFAVIDAQGETLLHSDARRNLRESFFDELARDRDVRAAVFSGVETSLEAIYRDRLRQLHVRPLAGSPWTLVTLADEEIEYMTRVEALSLTFLLLACYVLAALATTLGLIYARSEPARSPFFLWFWPDPGRLWLYRRYVAGCIGVGVAWLIAMSSWQPVHGVLMCCLFGLASISFNLVLLREGGSGQPRGGPQQAPVRHPGRVVLLAHGVALALLVALSTKVQAWPLAVLAAVTATALQRRVTRVFLAVEGLVLFAAAVAALDGAWGMGVSGLLLVASLHALTFGRRSPLGSGAASWKRWYAFGASALVMTAGVLPAFALFRAGHDDAMAALSRYRQLDLVEKLSARDRKLLARFQNVQLSEDHRGKIERELYPESLAQAADIHLPGGLSVQLLAEPPICEPAGGRASLLARLGSVMPEVTRLSPLLRSTGGEPGKRWCWSRGGATGDEALQFAGTTPRLELGKHGTDPGQAGQLPLPQGFRSLRLVSADSRLGLAELLRFPWLLALIAGLGLLWVIVRSVMRLVFLVGEPAPRILAGGPLPGGHPMVHRLELRRRHCNREAGITEESGYRIDSTRLWSEERPRRLATEARRTAEPVIIVDRFHVGLWDQALAGRKLELLERLVALPGKTIVVHSEVNPWHYFKMIEADFLRRVGDIRPDLGRWSAVLESFRRVREPLFAEQQSERVDRLRRRLGELRQRAGWNDSAAGAVNLELLAEECSEPCLHPVAELLAVHPELGQLGERELIAAVLDQAEDQYGVLWTICSKDERMVLYRLCQEGFVSWRSRELVRRLINRGLVRATPNPRPMSRSFRDFVTHAEPPEVFRSWEHEAGASVWGKIRVPVVATSVILMAFLFLTQPDAFEGLLAIATAGLAAVPLILRLLTTMTSPAAKGAGDAAQ